MPKWAELATVVLIVLVPIYWGTAICKAVLSTFFFSQQVTESLPQATCVGCRKTDVPQLLSRRQGTPRSHQARSLTESQWRISPWAGFRPPSTDSHLQGFSTLRFLKHLNLYSIWKSKVGIQLSSFSKWQASCLNTTFLFTALLYHQIPLILGSTSVLTILSHSSSVHVGSRGAAAQAAE